MVTETPNGTPTRKFPGFAQGETTRDQAIPAGARRGLLAMIEQIETRHGWTNKLYWELEYQGERVIVTELAPISTSVNARFMRRLAAINGRMKFPKGIDLSTIATTGYALVETEVDERGFNRVVDVAPLADTNGELQNPPF